MEDSSKPETISIEWEETTRCEAELTYDEVREMFGLGGTPDDKLAQRVVMIASASSFTELAVLDTEILEERVTGRRLVTVDGATPEEL